MVYRSTARGATGSACGNRRIFYPQLWIGAPKHLAAVPNANSTKHLPQMGDVDPPCGCLCDSDPGQRGLAHDFHSL
jgi:hypothetical protein